MEEGLFMLGRFYLYFELSKDPRIARLSFNESGKPRKKLEDVKYIRFLKDILEHQEETYIMEQIKPGLFRHCARIIHQEGGEE